MNKLIVFWLVMLVGTGMLVGIMAGGGGIVTTDLSSNVTSSAVALPVLTTTDFLDEDFVIVGEEKVFYTSVNGTTFLGCTRGYDGTTASAHEEGARVYTATASSVNSALGFNIVAVQDQWGWASIVALPIMFFMRTVPQIVRMSTNLLTGDLAVLAWFFYAMAAGFVVVLALTIIGSRRVV